MDAGSTKTGRKSLNGRRSYRAAAVLLVGVLHLGLFAALSLSRGGDSVAPAVRPIVVELLAPPPKPPPPPTELKPAAKPGGGAPATASRVHTPPTPPPVVPELPLAPPTPAPEPDLIVGAAPKSDPAPGLGQGGRGEGQGSGRGPGDGPGSGSRPAFIRGATNGEILSQMPRDLQRRRGSARSAVSCQIGLDTRLRDCTVVAEQPAGLGYGEAAIRVVETHFRFRPPTDSSGRPVEGQRVTVNIDFPTR